MASLHDSWSALCEDGKAALEHLTMRGADPSAELVRAVKLAAGTDPPCLEGLFHCLLGQALGLRGNEEQAEQELENAIQIAAAAPDRSTELAATMNLAGLRLRQCRFADARRLLRRTRPWVDPGPAGLPFARWLALRAHLRIADRRYDEAIADAREAARLADRAGSCSDAAAARSLLAWATHEAGDAASAAQLLVDNVETHRARGLPVLAAADALALALMHHLQGEPARSHDEIVGLIPTLRGSAVWFEETIAWAALAAVQAALDRVPAAEESLREAERCVLRDLNPTAQVFLFLQRGHLELARARAADSAGRRREARQLRSDARAKLARWQGDDDLVVADGRLATREVRMASMLLSAALDAPECQPLADPEPPEAAPASEPIRIADDATWFQMPGAPPMPFAKGPALRAILLCLARRRLETPGEAVPLETLIEVGWPDARRQRSLALNRLRVALHRLCDGPLGAAIVEDPTGCFLHPQRPLLILGEGGPRRQGARG